MKAPSAREAIQLATIDREARIERNRADWWEMLPLRDRMRAIGVAGLPRERAAGTLASFTNEERHLIVLGITRHCGQMELIALCLTGGAHQGATVH